MGALPPVVEPAAFVALAAGAATVVAAVGAACVATAWVAATCVNRLLLLLLFLLLLPQPASASVSASAGSTRAFVRSIGSPSLRRHAAPGHVVPA